MWVLIVSGEAAVRRRAASALGVRDGVEVLEALSAADARRTLAETPVDVLVIDGDMRPQGGQSLLYELRAQAEQFGRAAPPAVLLMGREQDRWLSDWAGAATAFVKPVDPFDLAAEVLRLGGTGPQPVHTGGELAGEELAMDQPSELEAERAPG